MNISKYFILFCLPLFLLLSCKKFLDVSADNQILEGDMFKDSKGVRTTVNGIYRLLSLNELYGKNLSWGFISALGYNYELNASLPAEMRDGANFDWQSANTQFATEQIWSKGYYAIANCNNILQQVEVKDSSFFQEGRLEKNMILGEMYGLRALVHFDLLRLFSPAPVTGYSGKSIPYVKVYPDHQPAYTSQEQVLASIIGDMEKAKTLLAPVDTIKFRNLMSSFAGRIKSVSSGTSVPEGDFFSFRAQRMNFFGATALLARIYLYKKDYVNAQANAQIAYDYHKRNWFTWTSASFQGSSSNINNIYTKRPEELLLTFANNKNYDNFEAITGTTTTTQAFRMNNATMLKLFEGDMDDYRTVGLYNRYTDQRYITWMRPRGTTSTALKVLNDQGPLLPVVRFSEMYHILIECMLQNNATQDAITMLNSLRASRGAKVKLALTLTKEQVMEKLVIDIIRETLTEGQTFFMFKRLGRNIFNGATDRIMNPQDWYSPLPQSEIAYQL